MQIKTHFTKKKAPFLAWGISLVLLVRAMGASPCELQGHEAPSVPWVLVALKAWCRFPFGWWACTCLLCMWILVAVFSGFFDVCCLPVTNETALWYRSVEDI